MNFNTSETAIYFWNHIIKESDTNNYSANSTH